MDNIRGITRLAKAFMAFGFIYLVIGTLILAFDLLGIISIKHDPIFMLELYGFVVMMVFGLSYVFVPGLSHSKYANYKSVIIELAFMNIGVILLFIGSALATPALVPALIVGLSLLIIAILIHAANIFYIMSYNAVHRHPQEQKKQL